MCKSYVTVITRLFVLLSCVFFAVCTVLSTVLCNASLVEQVFSSSSGNKSISPRAMINCIRRVGKQFRPHRQVSEESGVRSEE